ncbi:MAG: hypothetical protein U0790_02045 [Isosphaeraceae bacterium]
MKTVNSWRDLERYGIELLTGEACGLGYRLLCDMTAQGKKIIERCLGLKDLGPAEGWNRGRPGDPHVGSIMLTHEMLTPLAVFALLESGCKEVYLVKNSVVGIEASDPADTLEPMKRVAGVEYARRFAYRGTAGHRNVHVMTGRVE